MVFEQPPTPRHVDIAADLRQRINDGEWEPGDVFMSHREMTQQYDVSNSTAAAVRRILLAEGILEPRAGARMTIRRPPERRRIDRTTPAPASAALPLRLQEVNAGRIGEWASQTRPITADPDLARTLKIAVGDRVIETRYQFRVAGRIVRLAIAWEPEKLVGGTAIFLPEEGPYAGHPVEERMAAIGVGPLTVSDELVACPAVFEEAQLLGVGLGAAVLKVTRTYCGPGGEPVHVERSTVRGDTSSMVYRLSVG